MIAASDCVAALLAAGRGSRFGGGKLDVEIDGVTVGARAWRGLNCLSWHRAFVVVPPDAPQFARDLGRQGVDMLVNGNVDLGLSHSIVLAARAAQDIGAKALLLALADMPLVRHETIATLLARHDGAGEDCATVSRYGDGGLGPPALFGRTWFADLQAMTGDNGARKLLAERAKRVIAIDLPPDQAFDLDRQDDVARIAAIRSGKTDMSA